MKIAGTDKSNWPLSFMAAALLLCSASAMVLAWAGVLELNEANLLTASGGAMALGLILAAAGLFSSLQERREARALDAEFAAAEEELREALAESNEMATRFEAGRQKE